MHPAPTPISRQPAASRPLPPASAARHGTTPAAGSQLPVAPSAGARTGGPAEEVAAVAVLGYN